MLALPAARVTAQGTAGTGATATSSGAGTIMVTLTKAGDDAYKDATHTLPINAAECAAGHLTVDLTNLPPSGISGGYMFLEMWVQTGTADCTTSDRDIAVVAESKCTQLNTDRIRLNGTMIKNLNVPLTPANNEAGDQGVCQTDGPRTIYFLALKGESGAEATTMFGTLTVQVQTIAPDPVTNLVGYSGETEIPVKWTLPAERIFSVYVIIDPAAEAFDEDGGAGPGCLSRTLMQNAPFNLADYPKGLIVLPTIQKMASGTTINGDELHTNLAAVAVMVGDQAKNVSTLSNVGCIRVTPTSGFWDAYTKEGGAAQQGCSCSAPGVRVRGSALLGLPILGVLAWLGVRRRNRRQA
jgi:hypothetical protein